MSVAVAHLPSSTGEVALLAAAEQAVQRLASLTVIQIIDAVDLDVDAAHHAGVCDEMTRVLAADYPILVVQEPPVPTPPPSVRSSPEGVRLR